MTRDRRYQVQAVAGFVLGLSLLATSAVLALTAASHAREADATAAAGLSAETRQASAELSREIDTVRSTALLAATDTALLRLAAAAGAGDRVGAQATLTGLVGLRPGLVATARLRAADGRVVLAVPAPGGQVLPAAAGRPAWVATAMAHPGTAVTSAPRAAGATQVVSTAVALAPGPGAAAGSLELDTPLSWLRTQAADRVTMGWRVGFLTPEEAEQRLGHTVGYDDFGVQGQGLSGYGWSRTAFDPQLPGDVGVDSVVTVTVPGGEAAPEGAPLAALLLLLGLACLGAAAWAVVALLRGMARTRRAAEAANARLQDRLADMSAALGRVAAGDLAAALPVEQFEDDALRGMAGSFDSTLGRLRRLVGQAQDNGASLAHAAVELRAAAAQQAAAATEQTSVVTETTATIEELAATAAQIAQTAEQVAGLAGETLRLTEAGGESVRSAVEAMDAVAQRVDAIGDRAVGLGETGREIARILAVIDDLSERTNLLALNAAIEAARAGEHGQGFAVVAGEVRRLAERARASTTQIQALVSRIGAESSATVVAAGEGRQEVERAQGVAAQAATVLDRIAGMVDDTTLATREISIATQQQRSASDQVVVAMGQVSDATRQYAVGSRQAAASAQELATLAQAMKDTISTFATEPDPAAIADAATADADAGAKCPRDAAPLPVG